MIEIDGYAGGGMKDGKFHLPTRRKGHAADSRVIRVPAKAYNLLVDMYNDSQLSMAQIAGQAILYAYENAVYDKEEEECRN